MTQNNSVDIVNESSYDQVNNAGAVDLGTLFAIFMRHIALILIVTLVCGALVFFYYSSHTAPSYTSWFTGYVNKSTVDGSITNISNLSNSSLVSTYAAVITSKIALESAAEEIGIDKDYYELRKMISVSVSDDTQIIYIYVTGEDPNEVYLLADALASTAQEQVSRVVDGTSMRVMDAPDIPEVKYNVSITKRTIIGCMVGFVLTYGVLFLIDLLDDRVRDDKTIEEMLGLVILGTIPDFDLDANSSYYSRKYNKRGYYGRGSYERRTGQHEKQEEGDRS